MSQNYYNICCQYQGKMVRINDRAGNVHVGRIMRVSSNRVFIQSNQRPPRGFGLGYYGAGYGYGGGFYGIGLGFITGIALAGLFFW
ncbi:hypothetical protein [Metabacillus fastidiosus]|uniref:hypothetical protein n=1 Tax=Metabacillus fastidiosus TaxID=1458 RepID=UPI003D28FBB6